MKVSIIVPAFNAVQTLARCIDSILRQSLTDLELIVIDDGSTDRTGEICRDCRDDRLIYRYKENGGVSTARNLGLSLARGEYVGFVDADDYIAPDMCQRMYEEAAAVSADIGVCDYEVVHSEEKKETYTDLLRGGFFDRQQIREEVLPNFLGHVDSRGNIAKYDWAIIRRFFRRDFLCENKLRFDETLCNSEDCLFAYLATDLAQSMVYLKQENLYINIRNSGSLTRKYLPDYWQQRCALMDKLEARINETGSAWETKSFPLFVMRCVRPSFTNVAYGFETESMISGIRQFTDIVCDPRVRRMCSVMDPSGLNEEWAKLFAWCKHKRYVTLYLYYMDVQQHSRLCHEIRRIQKAIERRLR